MWALAYWYEKTSIKNMKNIVDFIKENADSEDVYVLYMDDNTMVNYFYTKKEAEEEKIKLEKENKDNKCTIKTEKKSNYEKV